MIAPRRITWLLGLASVLGASCGPAARPQPQPRATTETTEVEIERVDPNSTEGQPRARQSPPAPGPAREVSFPPVERFELPNGLEVLNVRYTALPIAYALLVIKSGRANDPAERPGLAAFVSSMLKEGTRSRTSAQIAEQIEYLGGELSTWAETEASYAMVRSLSDQLPIAFELMADVVLRPAFPQTEIDKLRRRELDRLALQQNDPEFLATSHFYRAIYGAHPYAYIDATPEATRRFIRSGLFGYHRTHYVPNNATLIVVGALDLPAVRTLVERQFGGWTRGRAPEPTYPPIADVTSRRVIIVDRPTSVQTEIRIGRPGIRRADAQWIPLSVANQVLGGSAASRLFMDLRERRSLTYGAYSRSSAAVDRGVYRSGAAVRTEVTGQALEAFFENLARMSTETPPDDEVADARRYLSDSFPLRIDTPGRIATHLAELRVFGLPDDYWSTYRARIGAVTPQQAREAIEALVRPDHQIVVLCGRASAIENDARRWGPVTVLDMQGNVVRQLEAVSGAAPAASPEAAGSP
ncbi:MAG: insulinase family protein [Deltaproteobacteria bacterium]|nr:insulinase family protein [Deltaproteobacteria bacterium]